MTAYAWRRYLQAASVAHWAYQRWRGFWPQTNLLMPDLKVEVMITIDPDDQVRVFFTKIDNLADIAKISRAIVQAGINLAESRGLRLELRQNAKVEPTEKA